MFYHFLLILVRLVIEQEIFRFLLFFLQIKNFSLLILNLHNSKTTYMWPLKTDVDLESTSKNTSTEIKKIKNIYI